MYISLFSGLFSYVMRNFALYNHTVHMIVFDNMKIRYTLNLFISHYQIQSYVHWLVLKVFFIHTPTLHESVAFVGLITNLFRPLFWSLFVCRPLFRFLFNVHRHVTSQLLFKVSLHIFISLFWVLFSYAYKPLFWSFLYIHRYLTGLSLL